MSVGPDLRVVAVAAVACLFVAVVGGLLVVRVGVPVAHHVLGVVRTVGGLVRPESTLGTAFLLGGILLLGVFGPVVGRGDAGYHTRRGWLSHGSDQYLSATTTRALARDGFALSPFFERRVC